MFCCYCPKKRKDEEDVYELASSTHKADNDVSSARPSHDQMPEKKALGPRTSDVCVENQLMYMTETLGGRSRQNSVQISLSTIFSSDDIKSSSDSYSLIDVHASASLESKLVHMSKSCRQYYKLTWTPPKHSNSTHGGSCSTAPSSAPSTLSSNVMRSQPVQRIRILKPSGSLTSLTNKDSTCSSLSVKISSTGAKLSNILEDSIDKLDDSVFQTPENTNPYYPNPNTPVDMVCWGICPPNNTPNETTDSEVDLDSSVKRMDWPVTSAVALQRSASVYSSKPLESAKPTTDQRHLKATADWLAEVQSLSIHSSELCASAPIHSSTITGAESLKRSLSNNSACTARSSSHSKKTASRRYTQSRQRMYLKSEGHQAVVRNSREERTFQWHYNKAFEEEGASSTINTSQIISSSVSMRCAYCSSLSHQRAPSEHVSIIAQVGSQSTSCVSLLNDQSEYSDQRTRGSYILRTPASTPQAPANSPQTLQKPFEHFINRLSSSSQALSNDVSRTFNNSLNKDHFCQQNQSYLQHLPLLSPKTYWV